MRHIYNGLIHLGNFLSHFLLLAIRLFWGYEFYISGLGKIQNPAATIEFFTNIGIPFATLNVYVAGLTELVGGIFLIVGFASRLVSLPLIATMVVAYLTAHREAVETVLVDPNLFVSQQPFNFLFATLIIFCFGPGIFSIDGILKRIYRKKDPSSEQHS